MMDFLPLMDPVSYFLWSASVKFIDCVRGGGVGD